jgi:predicted nuclease of predicted toxin-antitoxin system
MSERYLANENFPAAIVRYLRGRGDDVMHAALDMTGASDEEVLTRSEKENRILLTFDRDFGEMVFRQRLPAAPGIVLFRLRQQPPDVTLHFLRIFFDAQPDLRGMFTVASPGQFRQMPLSKSTGKSV